MNPDTPPAHDPTDQPACDAPSPFPYRGNGRIARLPKALRDQVNQWLLDGLPYPDMIQRLGPHGAGLKPDNLSQWKKHGHQAWLHHSITPSPHHSITPSLRVRSPLPPATAPPLALVITCEHLSTPMYIIFSSHEKLT